MHWLRRLCSELPVWRDRNAGRQSLYHGSLHDVRRLYFRLSGGSDLPRGNRTEDAEKPIFKALLAVLRSTAFHNELRGMGGYDLTHTGKIMAET